MAMGLPTDALNKQVKDLCDNFEGYLAAFNGAPPFDDTQLCYHKVTLDLRNKLGGVAKSIESDQYMHALYSTLEAWSMNWGKNLSYGPKMQEYDEFAEAVRKYKDDIASFEGLGLAQINTDVTRKLWRIIQDMQLSQTNTQIVTGAKALHHLLPKLLPPIDREYTQTFFHYCDKTFKSTYYHEDAFMRMLPYFARIAKKVGLRRYVGKERWATSESKMIDNAIIGYCRLHHGLHRKYKGRGIYTNGVEVDPRPHIAGCESCQSVARS